MEHYSYTTAFGVRLWINMDIWRTGGKVRVAVDRSLPSCLSFAPWVLEVRGVW